jgi:hypothetical protein
MRQVDISARSARWWIAPASLVAMVVGLLLALTAAGARSSVDEPTRVVAERSWAEHVALVDEAAARGDVSQGVRRWHDAYAIALVSRRPEALVAVGEASVRLGAVAGTPDGGKPNARQAYLAALRLARRQHAAQHVLAVAQAFRALGDVEVAEQCARLAEGLAGRRA